MDVWNHRIIRSFNGCTGCPKWYYGVYEVYYKKGKAYLWMENPCKVGGDSVKDIQFSIRLMMKATNKPVLYVKGKKLLELNTNKPARL